MSSEPVHELDAEDAPFLQSSDDRPKPEGHDDSNHAREPAVISQKLKWRLLITLFAVVVAVDMGIGMSDNPMFRIFESITCRKYYLQQDPGRIEADGQVKEEFCKVTEVQSEVAAVKGYFELFEGILCLLLAIPYGLMADRYGRKPTVCLVIPGYMISVVITFVVLWFSETIPLRAVWLSTLSSFIGGGPAVAFAVVWTMMSDVTSEEERASIFFKFAIALMAAELISQALGSWLMTMNPWVPLLLGWTISLVGILFTLTLPETLHASVATTHAPETSVEMVHMSADHDSHKDTYRDELNEDIDVDEHASFREKADTSVLKRLLSAVVTVYTHCRACITPYAFIFRNKRILLLLSAFLVFRMSRGTSSFVIQYISNRYAWTIAQSSFLMSFRPVLTIPLLVFILPAISRYYLRTLNASQKNLFLARASVVCLGLGTLGIGLSPNMGFFLLSMVIQSAGAGFLFLTRALLTVLVRREETARLFIILELVQSVGSVLASLLVTNIFQLGLELGGAWIGLAWVVFSFVFALVGLSMWMFRLPSRQTET